MRHLPHLRLDTGERGKIWECRDGSIAWEEGVDLFTNRVPKNRGLDYLLCKARKDQRSTPGGEGGQLGQCGALEAKGTEFQV